jgi:hypothetical protein
MTLFLGNNFTLFRILVHLIAKGTTNLEAAWQEHAGSRLIMRLSSASHSF